MQLVVQRDLPASAAVVWPLLTEPVEMNRWSTAPVRGLDPGDGGGFDAVGALRAVRLGRRVKREIEEVVEHADAPSHLVYRVIGTRAVRGHRGEQRLIDVGPARTRLTWTVDVRLPVPGAAAALEWPLRRELLASLDRLAAVASGDAALRQGGDAPTPRSGFTDHGDRAALEGEAEAVVAGQRALAQRLEAGGDARYWFARVYQYVTEALLAHVRSGCVSHPIWALRLIPRFHRLYERNMARAEGREAGTVEAHWQAAFDAISRAVEGSSLAFWRAVVTGARAHIEGDLPRVLADVWLSHYRGRCDCVRFRADYLLMAPAFGVAWDRLTDQVPSRWFPPYVRALRSVTPSELTEAILARRFYDPLAARRRAFQEGRRLADEALRGGQGRLDG